MDKFCNDMGLLRNNSLQQTRVARRLDIEYLVPWLWDVDDLRNTQPDLVLWTTITQIGPLERLLLPFLLHPREDLNGL